MIDKKVISELNPCKDRYDNFVKFYGHKSLTRGQFMGLKNITQSDKLWVAFGLMTKENIVLAGTDIAESVLHLYEKVYPNDLRPRQAIEAARSGDSNSAASAANAASDAAYDSSVYSASSAADAASAAAYAASSTGYIAASAASTVAACAKSAADVAAYDKTIQEKLIRKIVLKYWKN